MTTTHDEGGSMSEVEELRAEVERLTEELDRERLSQDYKPDGVDIVMGKLQDGRRRAEAAEAEVERLRETNARLNRRAQVAESAINELVNGTGEGKSSPVAAEVWERCQRVHENTWHRAEAAEAKLRDVEALANEWVWVYENTVGDASLDDCVADLRAVLARSQADA